MICPHCHQPMLTERPHVHEPSDIVAKLRRNPRGVMFELEHQCADEIERLQRQNAAMLEKLRWVMQDCSECDYGDGPTGVDRNNNKPCPNCADIRALIAEVEG